ncbi:MAG: hypothetical protein E7214_04010 [Clostridium sp.]|nr:hypothetical protein [Clostridium sp.]
MSITKQKILACALLLISAIIFIDKYVMTMPKWESIILLIVAIVVIFYCFYSAENKKRGIEIRMFIKSIQKYLNRNNIDIAMVFVVLGVVMSSYISYAWIITIVACFFIKDEEE